MHNKSGSVVIFALMLSMVVLILALAMGPILQDFTDDARNATSGDTLGMDCDNESISNFDKAACTSIDLSLFYFIGALIFIGGLIITAKVTFG